MFGHWGLCARPRRWRKQLVPFLLNGLDFLPQFCQPGALFAQGFGACVIAGAEGTCPLLVHGICDRLDFHQENLKCFADAVLIHGMLLLNIFPTMPCASRREKCRMPDLTLIYVVVRHSRLTGRF